MAQIAQVMKGDPATVADELIALAATNELLIIEKTFSSGEYVVVSDDAAGTGQSVSVLKGDPATVVVDFGGLGPQIDIVAPTFSAAQYIVVHV